MALFNRPALMWVTDRLQSGSPLPELVPGALAGGVDFVQLREKNLDRLPLELLVLAMAGVAGPDTPLVLNGHVELARRMGVGVHLPEAGTTIAEARTMLGKGAMIGRSVHSIAEAAESSGADYLVAGHVFETRSKEGRPPMGIDGFAEIVAAAPAPVLAIGGVTPQKVHELLQRGAAGVAVMSPLTQIDTIFEIASSYRTALEQPVSDSAGTGITARINGKPILLPTGTTIAAFLVGRELHERLVVVERNGEIVKRSTYSEIVIQEGDLLEIVHFVGGG